MVKYSGVMGVVDCIKPRSLIKNTSDKTHKEMSTAFMKLLRHSLLVFQRLYLLRPKIILNPDTAHNSPYEEQVLWDILMQHRTYN